jgi:predicted metal-dependent hydrolase
MRKPEQLPPYVIRESKKAKRVILNIWPGKGLEVVIPMGFDRRKIPGIVAEKGEWIQKTFNGLERKQGSVEDLCFVLPESIELRAVSRRFTVQYTNTAVTIKTLELVQPGDSRLELTGPISPKPKVCQELLKQWLKDQGRVHLVAWLERLSTQTGLSFKKAQIRLQKTRWGSCSHKGTISLNCKLLFLPPELVRYILLHELCHTVHLNHSLEYWSLMSKLEPDYRVLDAQVNNADRYVPLWAH